MKLEFVTLSGSKLSDDVYEVTLPTLAGEISVFPGHMPLVTVATDGVLYVRKQKGDTDEAREIYAINGGVVHIEPKSIRILVDEAEHADELVAAEVEKALELAQQQRASADDTVSISEAEALMNRQATRLKVANLRRRHRPQ